MNWQDIYKNLTIELNDILKNLPNGTGIFLNENYDTDYVKFIGPLSSISTSCL